MSLYDRYPTPHFTGTPKAVQNQITAAIAKAGVSTRWQAPLEVIGRYESNYSNPTQGSSVCPGCRGTFQLAVGMYKSAYDQWPKRMGAIDYADLEQGAFVAIKYVLGSLSGYGGYGTLGSLLKRTDRGPGEVLRYWVDNPRATVEWMRRYYNGY